MSLNKFGNNQYGIHFSFKGQMLMQILIINREISGGFIQTI